MEPRVHITIRIRPSTPAQISRLEVKRIRITKQSSKRFLLEIDRDLNASLNIKALGLQSVGLPLEAPAFTHGE